MKCIIVCGGEISDFDFFKKDIADFNPDLVIGADYGCFYLNKINLSPNLIIGDFDSLSERDFLSLKDKAQVIKLPVQKDEPDSEIALEEAIKRGYTKIRIYGAMGKRFDHAYVNTLLLNKALEKNVDVKIVDEYNEIFLINKDYILKDMLNKTVSILPFGEEILISLEGFFYPLNEYKMKKWDGIGLSNVVISKTAKIILKKGRALIVIPNMKKE